MLIFSKWLKVKQHFINCSIPLIEYWTIYRWPGFLAVVWFGSTPTPSPLLSASSTGDTQETEKERQFADGRFGKGMGVEPKHTTARKHWPSINHSIFSDPASSNDQIKWIATSFFSLSLSSLCGPYRSFASLTVDCRDMGDRTSSYSIVFNMWQQCLQGSVKDIFYITLCWNFKTIYGG